MESDSLNFSVVVGCSPFGLVYSVGGDGCSPFGLLYTVAVGSVRLVEISNFVGGGGRSLSSLRLFRVVENKAADVETDGASACKEIAGVGGEATAALVCDLQPSALQPRHT